MTGLSTLRNIRNFLHQTPVPSKPLRILAARLDLLQRIGTETPQFSFSHSPLFTFQGILK